ncbi:PQQ-binding-like beta-propeller repeat protein [Hyphomicrobium sp. LHD-15]|uniref:outer membrane protein assembly factor BamB family protein n=1 Tax=Hyphomicrobium sp. LHD-15 TaxID=3072142 RepID=UPI00280DD1DB|nr:PQQ-binding-like beta-propeller repeat protein [Hyphomicrobium sp. LHD-15]MDQ8698719.1 PQQ-binding-like beta-propeller repeat protein [Hyphomicrobium sp. LHD-15]
MAMTTVSDIEIPFARARAGASVAVGHAGQVYLLEAATGRKLWTQALATLTGASACEGQPVSVAISDEIVLAGCMGTVFALSIEDGSLLWRMDGRTRGAGETSLAVAASTGDYVSRLGN